MTDTNTNVDTLLDELEKALGIATRAGVPGAMSQTDVDKILTASVVGLEDGSVRLESFPVGNGQALTAYVKTNTEDGVAIPLLYFPTDGLQDILAKALGATEDGIVDRRDFEGQ